MKTKKIIACLLCATLFSAAAAPLYAAGRRPKVINDEWEEGWETTFFEKESKKKQILKKERPQPVLRREKDEQKPMPQSLYKVEKPAPEPEPEPIEDFIPAERRSSGRENNTDYYTGRDYVSSPAISHYAALKFLQGRIENGGAPVTDSFGAELSAGMKRKALRTEAAFIYNPQSEELNNHNRKLQAFAFLISMYADMKLSGTPELVPYVGAGAGMSNISLKDNTGKGSGSAFAYHASAGLVYSFTENIALDLGIRYLNYGSPEIKNEDFAFDSTQFMLGVKAFF